jgi:hypothetical protein
MASKLNECEAYNFINYLKIIDLSLLNIFDYLDFDDPDSSLVLTDNKIVLNLNAKSKKLLEGFIINNINDALYYGKTNILINTCSPYNNWRNSLNNNKNKNEKCILIDESIYVDEVYLNQFINEIFKKLPTLNAAFTQKSFNNQFISTTFVNISSQKNVKYLNFSEIDIYDSYSILNSILSNFGNILMDELKYNIIKDGNIEFRHNTNCESYIVDIVKNQLINQNIL